VEARNVPEQADEKETLQVSLDNHRAVVQWKLKGLTAEQGQWTTGQSATSLFGLVRHLALVERWWFLTNFRGEAFDHTYDFDADPDAEFRPHDGDTVESLLADYEEAIARSNAIIADAHLDDLAVRERRHTKRRPTLRWIMIHMIEETARHAGHADILRELVDGTTGYFPELA
jgi:hypothetical protein